MEYHYEPTHQCEVCQKRFHLKKHLILHKRTLTGEKPYVCSTCGKKFSQNCNLNRHQTTHSDERNFQCNICPDDRSFKTKDQFNSHMRFHYEPKHSCVLCNKKYHNSTNLKRHMNSHSKLTSSCS